MDFIIHNFSTFFENKKTLSFKQNMNMQKSSEKHS